MLKKKKNRIIILYLPEGKLNYLISKFSKVSRYNVIKRKKKQTIREKCRLVYEKYDFNSRGVQTQIPTVKNKTEQFSELLIIIYSVLMMIYFRGVRFIIL